MTRFGAVAERVDDRIPGIDLPLMSVSQIHGVVRRSTLTDTPERAESLDTYKVCRSGDIVFNKMSIRAGAMGVAPEDGLVTYHYEVMRPRAGNDPRFIVYLMKSHYFTGELVKRERGIGAGDASANVRTTEVPFRILRTIDCYVPPHDEQQAIADYLDCETQKIDKLVAEQRGLIDTLKERRQASIDARTEYSGMVLPLRRVLTRIRQGWSPSAESEPADGVAEWGVLKVGCSNTGIFRPEQNKRLPESVHPRPEHVVKKGEIVMSRSNTRGLVGAASLVKEEFPRLLLSDLLYGIQVGENVVAEYVAYAIRSRAIRDQIEAAAKGMSSSMQKISQTDIRNLEIQLPPTRDQRTRTAAIREDLTKIDALITESEDLIALSQERRAALITAAVNGQIDVRTAA